jgi:hypothetical protein
MSERKRKAKLLAWARYRDRCDKLVAGQQRPSQPGSPMRITPGFFRAEGWDTDNPRTDLRHGA